MKHSTGSLSLCYNQNQGRSRKGTETSVKDENKERQIMSTPSQPRREHPSTYVVQDLSSEEELARLRVQEELVTAGMGGVLTEQPDPASFQKVLDVGSGTGGWLIEMAKTYPTISLLIGVDVSNKVLEYARSRAEAEQVSDRVQFVMMDALRMLEFPAQFFDLVNQRFGMGYLRTWEWPKLLQEFLRVTKPGGVIRLTEADLLFETNSPALTRLADLLFQAFYQSGHLFSPQKDGLTGELAQLLRRYGVQHVQTRSYTGESRAGTIEGQRFYEEMKGIFRTHLPFLRKWTRVPDDYEMIYQQALDEMQQADFAGGGRILTAWGNKPE